MTYPGTLAETVEAKLVGNLSSVHRILNSESAISWKADHSSTHRKILLVGKDQEERIAEFVLVEHSLQLLTSLDDTISIVGIDHKDDTLSILEVVTP
jgi:hypothetical protein